MTRPPSTPRQPWWAVAVPQVNERTGRARLATDRWASSAHAVPEWPTFGGVAKPIAIVRAARGVACMYASDDRRPWDRGAELNLELPGCAGGWFLEAGSPLPVQLLVYLASGGCESREQLPELNFI